jgi:hypothetical protein
MKYAVEMCSGAMIIHTKFHKNWFTHSVVGRGIHRQHGDRISLLFFFKIREVGLKVPCIIAPRHKYVCEWR